MSMILVDFLKIIFKTFLRGHREDHNHFDLRVYLDQCRNLNERRGYMYFVEQFAKKSQLWGYRHFLHEQGHRADLPRRPSGSGFKK
ncbi:hypothetical protein DK389_13290 [Methylobacterium durans]|uniref:Uncharacterized protein n=1 Tax=Methylobacterium durans TaxID=2202825 RepID=A0A2U8W5I0_9HYPH|nr:hypothetical protein DK389_13290 [Methylobacterium durans]